MPFLLGVHRIQNFAIWPDPDPDISDPAGSGSEPDPSHLDPAGSGSKPRLLPTTGEKLLILHHYWRSCNDCLPHFVTELLRE